MKFRPEASEFLDRATCYLDCRAQMDAKYLEVDEFQRIRGCNVYTDSGGIETISGSNPLVYKTEYQQQSVSGNPVKTIGELYDAANIAKTKFEEIMADMVQQVCGNDSSYVRKTFPDLKGRKRAVEKANDDYSNRNPGPGISWLYDIVRGSIEFTSADQVLKCIEFLQNSSRIHIVKAKNRFRNPTLTGYRDLNFAIQIDMMDQGFKHICEIQIHHASIKSLDKKLDSHAHYEYFRSYFSGATDSLEDRLEDLKIICRGVKADESFVLQLLNRSTDVDRLHRLATLFEDQLCEYDWALMVHEKILEVQPLQNKMPRLRQACFTQGFQSRNINGTNNGLALTPGWGLWWRDQSFETKETDMAKIYQDKGKVKLTQGKSKEAMAMFEKALKIYKNHLREEVPAVADVYTSMGSACHEQRNLKEAMGFYQKAQRIYMDCFGGNHPSVACVCEGIGNIQSDQGYVVEAMDLYKKALDIRKAHFGEDDLALATLYNSIGLLQAKKGHYDEAMDLVEKSLYIRKRNKGEEHPDVAYGYNIMGDLRRRQWRWDEAMDLYQKAHDIYESNFGDGHRKVVGTNLKLRHANMMRLGFKFGPFAGLVYYGQLTAPCWQAMLIDEVFFQNCDESNKYPYSPD